MESVIMITIQQLLGLGYYRPGSGRGRQLVLIREFSKEACLRRLTIAIDHRWKQQLGGGSLAGNMLQLI